MLHITSITKTMARGYSVSEINGLARAIERGDWPLGWFDHDARVGEEFDPITPRQREIILTALRALAE
jgi:hypothetical protein